MISPEEREREEKKGKINWITTEIEKNNWRECQICEKRWEGKRRSKVERTKKRKVTGEEEEARVEVQ